MAVSSESVDLGSARRGWMPLVSSDHMLGNGVVEGIADVVYLVPERFDAGKTGVMGAEIACLNRRLVFHGPPGDFLSDAALTALYGPSVRMVSHRH